MRPNVVSPQEMNFIHENTDGLKVNDSKRDIMQTINQRKVECLSILTWYTIDAKMKSITRDKQRHIRKIK